MEHRPDLTKDRDPYPLLRQLAALLVFVAGFVLLGMAGLALQSAQTGLTPVWPASGFAFAMVYWFGPLQLLGVAPAMLVLAWMFGVPYEVALLSALGSMLEAGIPAYLVRRFAVNPQLAHLRDTLMFIALVPVLGPVFSATTGSLAFLWLGGSGFELWRLWMLWWLGNSVGLLVAGGFGLVLAARRSTRADRLSVAELLIAVLLVVMITVAGLWQVVDITSPLILYLLIPVVVVVARRGDQLPVLLLGAVVMAVFLLSASWLPRESLAQTRLGVIYLDVSLLWVVVFTGMLASSARREMHSREQVAWAVNHDPLTRLMNRHGLMDRLEALLSAEPRRGDVILLYLDLDHFKALNDAEGHRAGDQVLRDIGVMLGEEVRPGDTLARLGGDEFAAILVDCPLLDACAIAENMRSRVEHYGYPGRRSRLRVEASIGLVQLHAGHQSPEDALHDAHSACYEAKLAGRNRVWISDGVERGATAPSA